MTQKTPPPSRSEWAFGAGVSLLHPGLGSRGRVELLHPDTGRTLGPPSYQVCAVSTSTSTVTVFYHSAADEIIVYRVFDVDDQVADSDPALKFADVVKQASAMTATVGPGGPVVVLASNAALGVTVLSGLGPHDGTVVDFEAGLGITTGARWVTFAALPFVGPVADRRLPILAAALRSSAVRSGPGDPTGLEMYLFYVRPNAPAGPTRLVGPAVPVVASPPFQPHAVSEGVYFDLNGRRQTALFAAGRADAERAAVTVETLGHGPLTPTTSDGVWRCDTTPPLVWTRMRSSPWSQGHARLEELAEPLGGPAPAEAMPSARDLGIAYDPSQQRVVLAGVGPDPSTAPSRARPRYVKP